MVISTVGGKRGRQGLITLTKKIKISKEEKRISKLIQDVELVWGSQKIELAGYLLSLFSSEGEKYFLGKI